MILWNFFVVDDDSENQQLLLPRGESGDEQGMHADAEIS